MILAQRISSLIFHFEFGLSFPHEWISERGEYVNARLYACRILRNCQFSLVSFPYSSLNLEDPAKSSGSFRKPHNSYFTKEQAKAHINHLFFVVGGGWRKEMSSIEYVDFVTLEFVRIGNGVSGVEKNEFLLSHILLVSKSK